jgi:hypothetical protein
VEAGLSEGEGGGVASLASTPELVTTQYINIKLPITTRGSRTAPKTGIINTMKSQEGMMGFGSQEDRAKLRYSEQANERRRLWESIVDESSLSDQNKKRFREVLNPSSNPYDGVERRHTKIIDDLYEACIYSNNPTEALAVYKNIKGDIKDFLSELYS